MIKEPADTFKKLPCRKLDGGLFQDSEVSLVMEKELPVDVNGQRLFTASITPVMEKEFITGYLFGQGFINNADDIKSIEIENGSAKVALKDDTRLSAGAIKTDYRIVSGGGTSAYSSFSKFPKIKITKTISTKVIFKAMNTLFEKAKLYHETEGVHASGLFSFDGSLLCIAEDIGRHNTLDKIIGFILLNNIGSNSVFIVSTGRMASEMVMKICRAGIPLAATKTAVTDAGLKIGIKCGLTIIGFVHNAGTKINTDMETRIFQKAGMKIYSGEERVS